MRAFVLTAPGRCAVGDVEEPTAAPGEVVVDVERAGVCGTDVEFFTGGMTYLKDGHARYPMRIGHEWSGAVSAVGDGIDPAWVGRRVTGDTMLGDGTCRRCRRGHQHVCAQRDELGIRGERPGALAERVAVPLFSLHPLPDAVGPALGALVEPGANALRAARASAGGEGDRVLVLGPGTIGLLTAMFTRAAGAEVHVAGLTDASLCFARGLGVLDGCWTHETLPGLAFDAIVDATDDPAMGAFALERVEPGGRIVLIGLADTPSTIDTRRLVLDDVTPVGILSGSGAIADTITAYADGAVDPRPLVAATVGLDGVGAVLAGERPPGAGGAPKIHVDPRR